jgi:hypothetical protein
MKKSIITMMVLMLACAAWAQDVCYLIGTDGTFQVRYASSLKTWLSTDYQQPTPFSTIFSQINQTV